MHTQSIWKFLGITSVLYDTGTMSWDERDKGVKEVIVPESGVERLAKGEEKETAHEGLLM